MPLRLDLVSLALAAASFIYACSEPVQTPPVESRPSTSVDPVERPINHEAIVRDPLRTECLRQTAGRQHRDAVATCRRLVQRSRNPLNVATLANALTQSVTDGGADITTLGEATRLIEEALHSASGHPQRELWEEPAWSTAAEIHAALGDVVQMNDALEHLTWESQEFEQQDRRYYAELLRRAAQRE